MEQPDEWRPRYDAAATAWHDLIRADLAQEARLNEDWTESFRQAKSREQHLVESGLWRGGPRTLLAAIGMHYRELVMTAALAWLLRPDGHHHLGRSVLTGLCAKAGMGSVAAAGDVRVRLEERRGDTIADLVVYGSGWTLLVEAKTFSPERPRQLDRLYEGWQGEPDPTFIFLTRGNLEPVTAVSSSMHWRPVTWRQVAVIVRAAIADASGDAAPGVHDYVTNLELHLDV